MSVDTLSDVLQAVRLTGAVFFDVDTVVTLGGRGAGRRNLLRPRLMPDADHVIEYHVVTSGSCWATVLGHDIAPVRLEAGDVVAFPQGDAHVLSSSPGMRGDPDENGYTLPDTAAHLPLLLNLDGMAANAPIWYAGFSVAIRVRLILCSNRCRAFCMSTLRLLRAASG